MIARLSPEEYRVTQQGATERPGTGALLHNKEPGIYVDIVSGEPLFTSSDKYESGCGWPSFIKPIEPANINELRDASYGMIRTKCVRRMSTAISAMFSRMDRASAAECAIASIRLRCVSCRATRWRSRVTKNNLNQVEDI